jgi:hypothetical protein
MALLIRVLRSLAVPLSTSRLIRAATAVLEVVLEVAALVVEVGLGRPKAFCRIIIKVIQLFVFFHVVIIDKICTG